MWVYFLRGVIALSEGTYQCSLINTKWSSLEKERSASRDKAASLQDWLPQHQFTGTVLAANDNLVEVCKLDSVSLYGKGDDSDILTIDLHSKEYDIQPLRTKPSFQLEPMSIAMF